MHFGLFHMYNTSGSINSIIMYCIKNAQLPKRSGSRIFECEGRGANWLRGDSLWSLSSSFLLFQNIYIGLNPAISSLIEVATDCIWKQCRPIYVLHSYIRQIQNKSSKLHRSKKKNCLPIACSIWFHFADFCPSQICLRNSFDRFL
jgi:hypothetical protein